MTTQISTQTISFYGSELITLKVEDVIYTAVKPIVEAIGLDWGGQQQKLSKSSDKFNCRDISIVAKDGKIRQMLCMPLKKLNGWLFSINPEKVRPDLKDRVIQYQEECFEALYNYWNFGKAERKTTTDERTGLRQAVSALVSKKGLIYSDAYSLIHQRFNVEHIDELTPEQVGMAVEYVHKIYLEGELIIDEPKKEDEQLLRLLVSAYHFCYEAHELREKIVKTYIGWDIDRHFSPHYLHNLGIPLEQFLEKTRDFIHSNSERIMFVKGMNHLLEEPKQTARF
ncbi:phage antirepressor N-terminal domain-containing protein [Glaesserella parasuis]|uniref:phage antirepressor N-terminal domain-containing protein n=1 Tax=Glaesserella parasuis TaxID=738 RepID=UPI0021BEC610|nr:phage antirepressor N-terminal domain-containing protein [Glaesserella parasuis]MDG6340408.1 phage antirepressor N-terminal domain-containing protein [Glaesserella parasuis]MDG6431650.1 phage antirepressor N-terminal domain-containing protein [Glaesserella parasuis]MDG6766885.1 phage antirepressor N-terminal domain-containing protein [Glaesserella parasuis]MDG6817265.1 phage antirepressor N-terminal domain-containing protein [Glaesserella parasuis]MDP0099321.1 phage antirepressor N-terminal